MSTNQTRPSCNQNVDTNISNGTLPPKHHWLDRNPGVEGFRFPFFCFQIMWRVRDPPPLAGITFSQSHSNRLFYSCLMQSKQFRKHKRCMPTNAQLFLFFSFSIVNCRLLAYYYYYYVLFLQKQDAVFHRALRALFCLTKCFLVHHPFPWMSESIPSAFMGFVYSVYL